MIDSFEDWKIILKDKNVDLSSLTIYEFFFQLNKVLKPQSAKKENGK